MIATVLIAAVILVVPVFLVLATLSLVGSFVAMLAEQDLAVLPPRRAAI